MPTANALSVDVEDYYQVQALSAVCARADWDRYESRVERNTDLVLEILARHFDLIKPNEPETG